MALQYLASVSECCVTRDRIR